MVTCVPMAPFHHLFPLNKNKKNSFCIMFVHLDGVHGSHVCHDLGVVSVAAGLQGAQVTSPHRSQAQTTAGYLVILRNNTYLRYCILHL